MGGLCSNAKQREKETGFADSSKPSNWKKMITAPGDLGDQEKRAEYVANLYKPKLRPDGTEKDDYKPKKAETPAAVAPVVEETTTTTTTADSNTPTTSDYTPTDYGNPSNTAAAQSVLADQERGPKSGTIETSAQGISKDDTSGLRPKRKLKPKGLLTTETPARNQSLLAAA